MRLIASSNVIVDLIGVIVIFIILMGSRRADHEQASQRLFDALLITAGVLLLVDIPAWLLNGSQLSFARPAHITLNLVYYALQINFCFLWLVYTEFWMGFTERRLRARLPFYIAPLLLEYALLVLNLYTGWIYTVSDANFYSRGPFFTLNSVLDCSYILFSLVVSLRACAEERDKAARRRYRFLASFMLLPIIATVLQVTFYGASLIWPFVVLSLLMVNINVQQEQLQAQRLAALSLENELTNNRVAIMLSQIQPHFLYNALCVVQDLCHGKAPEAEQATAHFSEFLRSNLDSINATAPIPFARELVHSKNYLYLEKLRFNERLNVVYDIRSEDFRLPSLTLQPLTENAVRYGVTSKLDGGTVTIASWEDDTAYYVSVTDDGAGFDPQAVPSDGRSHVGIDNVRGRVRSMCGGELLIQSAPGRGACAKIILPKEAATHDNTGC